jgi:hypothetical protein
MSPSDSRRSHTDSYAFPSGVEAGVRHCTSRWAVAAGRRAGRCRFTPPGLPGSWLIVPHAPSPITPGSPHGRRYPLLAHAVAGFTTLRRAGRFHFGITRPNRVRIRYGSRVRRPGLRRVGLLRPPPGWLPRERAITWVTSLQMTRSARLHLAHLKGAKPNTQKKESWHPRRVSPPPCPADP